VCIFKYENNFYKVLAQTKPFVPYNERLTHQPGTKNPNGTKTPYLTSSIPHQGKKKKNPLVTSPSLVYFSHSHRHVINFAILDYFSASSSTLSVGQKDMNGRRHDMGAKASSLDPHPNQPHNHTISPLSVLHLHPNPLLPQLGISSYPLYQLSTPQHSLLFS
jgi:hypothetical protein